MTRLLARAALAAACAALPARAAQGPADIETKVQLESAQEARLQTVLRKVLGSEDVLVIVEMELAVETRPRMTEVLPGVPAKDSPAAADLPSVTRSSIKSLNATVILDDSSGADAQALAQRTAEQVLGLDLARGDMVTVKKMRLRPQLTAARPDYKQWLAPPTLVPLFWLFAGLAALGLLYGRFLHPLLGVLRDVAVARAAPAAAPAAMGGMIEPATDKLPPLGGTPPAAAAATAAGAEAGDELPFSFLRDRHVPMLKFLLRRAPPRTAAVIVHYLPAKLAVDVLGELTAETRLEVAKSMSKVVQLDEENVRQIEDSLRARIDYLMGGEDKLAEILDQAPAALQDEMLAAVRGEDAQLGARLSRRLVRLEDIGWLDANDLKTLSRRVPIRSLAAVLRACEEIKAQVLPKLTSGLGSWLAQEIELAGTMSGDRLAAEQKRVLATFTQLVREGTLKVLRPDEAGAPRLPHGTLETAPAPEPPEPEPAPAPEA